MRLDKFLVACAVGSRTEVKNLLKAGRVTVNGKKEKSAKSAKLQIDEKIDEIRFDGQVLEYEEFVYYMMNKPKGVISATEDPKHRTVLDLLDDLARSKEVFPVGRLDIDTHGLLLLTNDGQLAHVLLSPKRHVDKTYLAQVKGIMTQEDVETFAEGIPLKDFTCQPAILELVSIDTEKNQSQIRVTIAEGKFHQIKRMVGYCGKEVVDLQRLTMGTLVLDENLERGEWRRLTKEELEILRANII
ncbi:TPA: rRNA pseudouridine synthase [Streptococcus pneumoniae]|nr:ribosomal small subunit pseudouridine synthase A [Streptococcus pneumoniae]HEV1947280.1 rRNA pseudouridine synthase [Streptococcus pneumoniae]